MKEIPIEPHPLFPSGEWEGFYKYPWGQRDEMKLILRFNNGVVTGSGSDLVGGFSFSGAYSTSALDCVMVKTYVTHDVHYKGNVDENGIWGFWDIRGFSGAFHIWPKKGAENENKEKETQAEELEKVVVR